jgi:glycosyltransferase involved in cell wall biosynthesis
VNNFPLRDELQVDSSAGHARHTVCYVGAIAGIRGIGELVRALELVRTDVRLDLCGEFSDQAAEQTVRALPGWTRVNERGQLGRAQIRDVLATAVCGVVTFLPLPNHVNAQPNKMFEYMSAGVPVIASDFPLWREIVGGSDCGVLVNPRDPGDIARAIDRLVSDPVAAARMGRNGRSAVLDRYHWEAEVRELFTFYGRVLERPLP